VSNDQKLRSATSSADSTIASAGKAIASPRFGGRAVPLSTRAWAHLRVNTRTGRFDHQPWAVDERYGGAKAAPPAPTSLCAMARRGGSKSRVDNAASRVVSCALKYVLVSPKRSNTIAQSGVDPTAWCYCFESTRRRCDSEDRKPYNLCPSMFSAEARRDRTVGCSRF
jgi:hypothetical protein